MCLSCTVRVGWLGGGSVLPVDYRENIGWGSVGYRF